MNTSGPRDAQAMTARDPGQEKVGSMLESMAGEFSGLRGRLLALEKTYSPAGENLHFEPLSRADAALYKALLGLAKDGLTKVRTHREYFPEHSLYDDGMFWYDLLLLISAAAQRMHADRGHHAVPTETATALVETLVEISEFTVLGGDITKRNFEALGNTLWTFWSLDVAYAAREASFSGRGPMVDCWSVILVPPAVVAPTGFEPVNESGHVFAKS